ncbi:OmpA family protein [Paraburkholderia antibiotica]|uniref:OmpA family protein n=1 Tax=Paraburkholderia antibiotica TaxID=2728839 RepID=UPI002E360BB5|nr:OmpA family protein [Paraburkholderia antibiotica]
MTTVLIVALALAVLPVDRVLAWWIAAGAFVLGTVFILFRTWQVRERQDEQQAVMAALGSTTADLPASMRTRMPVFLVTGDGLAEIFDREGCEQLAWVGEGAIWLRIVSPQNLPRIAVAVRRWRDGRAPEGVVLTLTPAAYGDDDALGQKLRLIRQAASDASKLIGTRLPGYVAIYQRLGAPDQQTLTARWYGVSSATPFEDAARFEAVVRAAERTVWKSEDGSTSAWRAAELAALVDWTQRAVIGPLHDRHHPAARWNLHGIGWINCGPQDTGQSAWKAAISLRTRLTPPIMDATPAPWPLPQAIVEAAPLRLWVSPRLRALAHVLGIAGCVAMLAFWAAGRNNHALLDHIGADLERFATIPANHDAARQDALKAIVADRDRLLEYQRTGVPLRLSFGMYRGAGLIPVLDRAIASYQPPPPPPSVVTLDSMSLFDSGRAQLKDGSTRVMVNALEMIKLHPDKRILVAGYTDNVGEPESNLKLSTARAEAVRDWLIEASGIASTQFAIQGFGDTRPIAGNDTDEGRAKNRRVEITLVPDAPTPLQKTDLPASTGTTPR